MGNDFLHLVGDLGDFKLRIEGLKAELRQREGALKEIMAGSKEEEEVAVE